jgi:hypothetical protein
MKHLRQQTAKEIIEKHTKHCKHTFVATLDIIEWLKQFKAYLPPKNASEHAKGAHDAIDDLETWVFSQDCEQKESGETKL